MKITQVISDSNVGGAGILIASVAKMLKNDFEFEIIIPRGSMLAHRVDKGGIKITELDFKRDASLYIPDARLFYRYFKDNPTDVVHTHASLSARIGAHFAGIPLLISTRHCAKEPEQIKEMNLIKRLIYDRVTDLTISTADFATANLVGEGVKKSKIITIKNGVSPLERMDKQSVSDLRQRLNIPEDSKIIGCCGRLESVKGQDLILRAAPKVLSLFPNTKFMFIGDGSMRAHYRNMASLMGIEHAVIFVGYTERPYIYQNLFYCNLNASRGTETSCLATSECMSLGIPTVASDFGGNTEMITHLKNGLLFEKDNLFSLESALITILSFPALHERLSEGALEVYKSSFCAKRMASEYKSLYLSAGLRGKR